MILSSWIHAQERAAAERAEAHYQLMLNDQLTKTQAQMARYE